MSEFTAGRCSSLSIRIADLLRRVNGLYVALIRSDGETLVQAGDASLGSRVAPLALALLDGGGDLCGASRFEHARLSSASRVIHVHRVDAQHILCVVMEPRIASAPLFIQAEAAALRTSSLPSHERVSRIGDALS